MNHRIMESKRTLVTRMKNTLKDFTMYTSLHGLNRMMESKSMIGKIIWCLLFLTCTVLSGRQIFLLILQYTR